VGSFLVELLDEIVEFGLLLETVHSWRARLLLLQGEMHALMTAVLLGMAGLDALDGDAEPQPPDGEPREIEQAIGAGEGTPLSERMAAGRPRSPKRRERGDGKVFAGGSRASHIRRKREAWSVTVSG
jgi:hypothetical protein